MPGPIQWDLHPIKQVRFGGIDARHGCPNWWNWTFMNLELHKITNNTIYAAAWLITEHEVEILIESLVSGYTAALIFSV